MPKEPPTQAELNQLIARRLPGLAWESTVAVVVSNKPAIHLIGTGTLFQVADARFVLTAAHVLAEPHTCNRTIGVTSSDDSFIALGGTWIGSAGTRDSVTDPFDIAVFRLPDSALARLAGKRFVRGSDISFLDQPPSTVFAVLGFPGPWSLPIQGRDDALVLKPLEFFAVPPVNPPTDLAGFNPRYHLLVDASPTYLSDELGYATGFTDRAENDLPPSTALKGISGANIWAVADLTVPRDTWHRTTAKVVAVQTRIYPKSNLLRATRWTAVATLLHEAFPKLRPAIALWSQ